MDLSYTEMETPSTAAEWLAQFGEGELTPAHRSALAEWLRESPANVRQLLELTLLRQDLGAAQIAPAQLEAWIHEALSSSRAVVEGPFQSRGTLRPLLRRAALGRWRVLAASVAAIVLALAAIWQSLPGNRYATRFGEQRTITLEEGSVVSLNTESEIKVELSDHVRSVELLEGEAFFRVSHDPSRPFEVTARDAIVKAVGTQFNVRVAPIATIVSVVDGAVEVRGRSAAGDGPSRAGDATPPILLQRGEEARIRTHEPAAKVRDANAQRTSAWTRGRIEFEGTALEDVLAEFRRYRPLDVAIEGEAIRRIELTGSFDARDAASALAYMDSLPQLEVEQTGPDAFVIRNESR